MEISIYHGDCLGVMPQLPAQSIDAIITDIPYGTTQCKWDIVIPFEAMWNNITRMKKKNTPILLFGSEPFSSLLRISKINWYRYDWIWDKKIPSGMAYARYQPMRQHEYIHVFMENTSLYNPQMIVRDIPITSGGQKNLFSGITNMDKHKHPTFKKKIYTHKYPTSIISFMKVRKDSKHSTQKPVALMEYLIKTYSNEGDTILDFTMGSGTTGIAAYNTGRNFIGIEKDIEIYHIARQRMQEHGIRVLEKNFIL